MGTVKVDRSYVIAYTATVTDEAVWAAARAATEAAAAAAAKQGRTVVQVEVTLRVAPNTTQ